MNGRTDPQAEVPTAAEVAEAQAVLSDGVRAVELGNWNQDMQEARTQAHAVLSRARAAGVL